MNLFQCLIIRKIAGMVFWKIYILYAEKTRDCLITMAKIFGAVKQAFRYYGSKTLQGIKTKYSFNQLTAGYLLNPANRLSIEMNIAYRSRNSSIVNQSRMVVWYWHKNKPV